MNGTALVSHYYAKEGEGGRSVVREGETNIGGRGSATKGDGREAKRGSEG